MGRNIIYQLPYKHGVLKNMEKYFNMENTKVEICTTIMHSKQNLEIISQMLEKAFSSVFQRLKCLFQYPKNVP